MQLRPERKMSDMLAIYGGENEEKGKICSPQKGEKG
jgi:hypothetical protein